MHEIARQQLTDLLRLKGIKDESVLNAINQVPRHEFIPEPFQMYAYEDIPLGIGEGQTISQPFIVALMTQALLAGKKLSKVLEIGTGSGYQAAILSLLVDEVYSIERIRALHEATSQLLKSLNYQNIHLRYDDGTKGWLQAAPFDAIIVTAAAAQVPEALKEQLKDEGRLITPVVSGEGQVLEIITRHGVDFKSEFLEYVRFVPLLSGKA